MAANPFTPTDLARLKPRPTTVTSTRQPHWLGEPASEVTGSLGDMAPLFPTFGRVPFGTNRRLDMIVRLAAANGEIPVPTAVVSKRYVLVQHTSVIEALENALRSVDVDPPDLQCRLTMSESGARMAMRVELPERFAFNAPDEHQMALTFECFNSVDRTVPFFALLGWFRFVCSNGLVVGTTHAAMRQHHRPSLHIRDLEPMLTEGLAAAACDRDLLTASMARRVSADALRTWVDGPVAKKWGAFAAARVHAIATTGLDGEPSRTPKGAPPHARHIVRPIRVPGAEAPCRNSYGLAQALAWVAARRNEVAERVAWRGEIPELMAQLQSPCSTSCRLHVAWKRNTFAAASATSASRASVSR